MAIDIAIGLSAAATGTVDVITATYSPAPTLVDRKILFLRTSGTNTVTTPTFNPNALGAKTIVKQGGVALAVGDLKGDVILMYNLATTQWELINPIVKEVGTSAGTVADGLALATLQNRFISIYKAFQGNTSGLTARKIFGMHQGQINAAFTTPTSGTDVILQPALIYIKSTEYPTINGVAPVFKIRAGIFTNDVAPAVNYSISLNLMTCPAASGGINSRAWTIGSNIIAATQATPAADSNYMIESAEFALPADGWYSICFANDGTTAVNSAVEMFGELLVRN